VGLFTPCRSLYTLVGLFIPDNFLCKQQVERALSLRAQAEATDQVLAQGLSTEDAALAGKAAAAASSLATSARAVARDYELTCLEVENAKQVCISVKRDLIHTYKRDLIHTKEI